MRIYSILFFSLLISCTLISCKHPHQNEKKYINLIIKGNKLFALTASGHINIFDANTNIVTDTNIHADTTIVAMNIDRKGNIIVVKSNQKIDLFNERQQTFKTLYTDTTVIYDLVFDKTNKKYLITDKGITDISVGKTYLPDTSLHFSMYDWQNPSAVFIDNYDNIWVGNGHGEWGGSLCIFNTKVAKFMELPFNNKTGLDPVNSIFSDGTATYISCGLVHFEISGSIMKFIDNKYSTVFTNKSYWIDTSSGKRKKINAEYVGPSTYNTRDKCIYFYSQNGIFKGHKEKDLSKITTWIKIASPKFQWSSIGSHAVGPRMNVLKMQFAPNGNLYLVTQNDGIGVYDGKNFSLLN